MRGSHVVGPSGGPQGLRAGSFFPSLLERRRRIDQALFAVVMEARSLKARGLAGTQLVISDAHTGLKAAIAAVLLGAAWQGSSADITTRREVPVGHLRRRERTLAA